MLLCIIRLPVVGSLSIILFSNQNKKGLKPEELGLFFSIITRRLSIYIIYKFDKGKSIYQIVEVYSSSRLDNSVRSRGIDGISVIFVFLTTIIIPLCIIGSKKSLKYKKAEYYACFRLRETRLRAVFIVIDRMWFYIAFEGVRIPIFLRIGTWGGRERKVRASYYMMRYTLLGSFLILISIRYLYIEYGSMDILRLKGIILDFKRECIRWVGFFVSFAVKLPMIPFHIWLPEAHVEAPTAGSVILASVILKMGGYGILRRIRPMFPNASLYFQPIVFGFGLISMRYSSRIAIRQTDMKRVIAYSSIAHINLVLAGLFCINEQARLGAIFLMFSHGIVSAGRFFLIGIRYDRYHTRLINNYGGIVQIMPRFGILFFIFTLANMGRPGMGSFIGEFILILGIMKTNMRFSILSGIGLVLTSVYSLWRYNRIIFGNIKPILIRQPQSDRDLHEFVIFVPLVFFRFILGIFPNLLLDYVQLSRISNK